MPRQVRPSNGAAFYSGRFHKTSLSNRPVTAFTPDAELPAMLPHTIVRSHAGRRGAAFRPAGTQARQVASMDSGKSAFAALTAAVTSRGVDGTGQAPLTAEQRQIVTR